MIAKPERIFARDREWAALARYVAYDEERPHLGVVSGRRRQGKTFLLESLTHECDGLYFEATNATPTESLRSFGAALTVHTRSPAPLRFENWDEAISYLFRMPQRGPIVLDEFPYLSKNSPELPSIIAREIDRGVFERRKVKLLLCGSAMSVMGRLLSGDAPLRGRAVLELTLRPFDYPLAARFWGAGEPRLAAMLGAVVGGTPAYRSLVMNDIPSGTDDFDDWVLRTVLNPTTPIFREARYLLDEEPEVSETALYHSILAAVANGNRTRGGIAGYVGRKSPDLSHYLTVLEDSGILRKDADVFRKGRSEYHISEPLLTFYHVVMRSQIGLLESDRALMVWAGARTHFTSQVLGPAFEETCRQFARVSPPETFGELPGTVGAGVVTDPKRHTQIEIDVAVLAAPDPGRPRRVLSLGEAKWGKVMGTRHMARLHHARDLLTERGYDTRDTVLACYSGTGFEPTLRREAEDSHHVLLADLDTLYRDPAQNGVS